MNKSTGPRHPDQLVALAVGRCYRAFEGHHLGSSMSVRRTDVTAADVLALAQPLRQVEPGAIDRWLPHAASSWGTVEDLKALLPRVFDLFAIGRLATTPEILFGKLHEVDAGTWPVHERGAVDDVLTAVWLASLADHPARVGYPAWRVLAALAELGNPLTPYLDDWYLLLGAPGPTGAAAKQHYEDLVRRAERVREQAGPSGDLADLFWSAQPREAGRLARWVDEPYLSPEAR